MTRGCPKKGIAMYIRWQNSRSVSKTPWRTGKVTRTPLPPYPFPWETEMLDRRSKSAVTRFKKSLPKGHEVLVITRPGFFFGESDLVALIQRDGRNSKLLNYLCPALTDPWQDFEAVRT